MSVKHFILATAGHVDHGKSSLVKALTGTDPDRLPEEKARGITIDLGFAHLELPSSHSSTTSAIQLGIVDVPGHEDFVKNMVAGVGSIDLALLVVAADDGWMPQTEEHLQILTYLGVTHAVVALTKIDLAENHEAVITQIRQKLAGTPFANAPIIKTSVLKKEGLGELKTALAQVTASVSSQRDIGKPRLSVDRAFTLHGIGTVVTGTLTGGTFQCGQTVIIQPYGITAHIRAIQSHNQEIKSIGPGTRTALNLSNVSVITKTRSSTDKIGVHRGCVITLKECGAPNKALDVILIQSSRATQNQSKKIQTLKDGAQMHFHHGSGSFPSRTYFIDRKEITVGKSALAQLRFDTPIFAFTGDRFILRDWPEQNTIAGGMILDSDAQPKNFHTEPYRKYLGERAVAPDQVSSFVVSHLTRDGIIPKSTLLTKSRFSETEISEAISHFIAGNKVILIGGFIVDIAWWQKLYQRAVGMIDTEHQTHSEHIGLPLHQLRQSIPNDLDSQEIFERLVSDLCKTDFIQVGAHIRRKIHKPMLPPNLQAAGAKIRPMLAAKPFDPPSRKELAPDHATQQALHFLIQTGEAIKLDDETVLLVENFARAIEIIRKYLSNHPSATVSELRQTLGTSRRIAVPLLERLDRDGITIRQGDQRSLKK